MGTTVRTSTHARVRATTNVLEGVLWCLVIVTALTSVVRPLVGPALLGIGTGPYWGAAPSVTADVADSVWAQALEENGGTLPAFGPGSLIGGPFGPGDSVEATLPNTTDVSVWAPMTFRQLTAVAGAPILDGLVLVAALLLAILVVRDLRRGRLFSAVNLRRTYAIAAVVAIGGTIAQVAGAWGRVGVLESPRLDGYVVVSWSVSWMPLVVGLTIACAAEVLRLGMRMQRDVEGLV